MKRNSYLNNVLDKALLEAQYDEHAKRILKDKRVLSHIIKYTVEEFKDYSLEEIQNAIEDDKRNRRGGSRNV